MTVTTRPRKSSKARRHEGFTLVELMMVVAIMGILAVLSVVGYRKYILNSKITEAQNVLAAIRLAQEDYRVERGIYADLGATYCPTGAGVSNKKYGWDPGCSGGKAAWNTLPVHVDGPVQFRYATVADTATFTVPTDASGWISWGTVPAGPWYVAMARCDLDGVSSNGDTQLVVSSFNNQVFSRNNGQ